MPSRVALPHRTAGPEAWEPGPWEFRLDGAEWMPIDRPVKWTPGSSLELRSDVTLDVDELFRVCGLERSGRSSDTVALLASWWSHPGTRLREVASRVPIPGRDDRLTTTLQMDIGDRPIAGLLHVERQVILTRPGGKSKLPAAVEPGALLLSELTPTRVPLEGSFASLVVESVDFERAPIAARGAIWYLEMDLSDLDAPFQGCYRVCINTQHPLCRRLEASIEGGADDPYAAAALSVFGWDVARAMLMRALDCDELLERWDDEFDSASAGGHLVRIARICFPADDGRTIRKRRDDELAAFERGVQAFGALLRQ